MYLIQNGKAGNTVTGLPAIKHSTHHSIKLNSLLGASQTEHW
jgi:hypothetical protein